MLRQCNKEDKACDVAKAKSINLKLANGNNNTLTIFSNAYVTHSQPPGTWALGVGTVGTCAMMAASFVQRTFSGIQPTGSLHLGNYFGAVRRWRQSVEAASDAGMQPHQQIFSVVDLHAITLPQVRYSSAII